MALSIASPCVGCWACVDVCPSDAITAAPTGAAIPFTIDPQHCSECDGDFADPQCASICPVEAAILDAAGAAINPPGSLTGIPPERWAAIAGHDHPGESSWA